MKNPVVHDPHDRFFKESFGRKEFVVPFLQRVLPESLCAEMAWDTLEVESGSFLDESLALRSSDLLLSAKWAGNHALLYCLFEHQSTSDALMPLRLLRYMVRIWDRWLQEHSGVARLPLIIPVVLYQGLGGWTASADLRPLIEVPPSAGPAWESYVPTFGYRVIDIHDKVEQNRFENLIVGHLLSLFASVMLPTDDERIKRAFAAIERLHTCGDDLAHIRTAIQYLFSTSGDVDRSSFARHIKSLSDTSLKQETMSIAELLREEGLEQGREEGRFSEQRAAILEALEVRFGSVPTGLVEVINALHDHDKLRALHRTAIRCADIDSFASEL